MRRAQLLGSIAWAALVAAAPAAAQVTTSIKPDTNAFATGTIVSQSGTVTTITGGTQAGGNLFHSFTTFNLAQGDTATWTAANPGSVTNVINRVTGGTFSTIAGVLDTTALPNAAFYFINPAGVLFTGGARLNVPGAAYISTAADGLTFADGLKFSAVTPNGSSFSMSAPQSFGFLGAQQPIIIDTVADFLPFNVVDLSLFASDLAVRNSSFTPHTITISTTGTWTGSLSLADPFDTAPLAGQTILNNALIAATATGKGLPSVRIATGAFTQVGGELSSGAFFSGDAGDLLLAAQTADIEGGAISSSSEGSAVEGDAGTVRLTVGMLHVGNQGSISSSTFTNGAAGDVIINAGAVMVDGKGLIDSGSHDGAGHAGAVQINATSVMVAGGGSIESDTFGAGDAGSVQIAANTVAVTDGGDIGSSTISSGNAGAVQIAAGALTIDNGIVDSGTLGGTGKGGLVTVQADQVTVTNQGSLASFSSGPGGAGAVQIKAGTLTLTNQGNVLSNGLADGSAGSISISATNLNATDGLISSDSAAAGRAGVITIAATNIGLSNSTITSEADGSGAGGDVTINAGAVSLTNNSIVGTDTFGTGAAGRVDVVANTLSLTGQSAITSAAEDGSGAAGQISIQGGALTLDGSVISSTTFTAGAAGDVLVSSHTISLTNAASIESGAGPGSSGAGGQVQIQADSLSVLSTSGIVTSTVSSGDAGQLTISATNIVVDEAQLASRAQNGATGAAGSVSIQGQVLSVVDGGQVETASDNPTTAGALSIAMRGGVTVSGEGSVISSANTSATPGAAGSIGISGGPIVVADGGSITTNSVAGAAGDISFSLPRNAYVLLEGQTAPGVITTSSGPGTGGRISIGDPVAIISNGGHILALGQESGANVQLTSDVFVRSADRDNELAVNGVLVLDSLVTDVSAGAVVPDIAFLDASGVLRGQCPAARDAGLVSQLRMRPFGPYAGGTDAAGQRLSVSGTAANGCLFAPQPIARSLWARAAASVAADEAAAHAQAAFAQVPGAAPPLAPPSFASVVAVADVQVSVDPGAGQARPLATWRAGPDPATGLTLQAPGPEGFDAAWVRAQFVANRLVGQPAPLDRLLALAQLINLALVRNGYVNSGVLFAGPIPRDGGVLQLRLVLGRAGRDGVRVRFGPRGAGGLSDAYVRQRMAAAAATPFNALDMEAQFRRLAQDPAVRTVSADLVPGAAPGEANLEVTVDPAPRYDLYATAANSRSPSIGGERYAIGGSVRNLAMAGDLATAEAGVTGGRWDESVGYDTPLGSPSWLATLRAEHDAAAVVDETLRPLGIRSTDWSVEGGVGWRPLDRPLTPDAEGGGFRPAQSLTLGLHLSHREQETWLLGQPFSFSPGSQDGRSQYTALRLTADYVRRDATQVLAVSAVAVQGLGGSRSDGAGELNPSGEFHDVLAQASYARRLGGHGLELRLRGAAQWADGPLYTGEKFSLGGEETVRGYRENLILSDTGAFASAELAQAFSLDGGRKAGFGRIDWGAFTASAFIDGGVARNRAGPNPDPSSLASVGSSLAWTPSEAIFAKITYAKALRDARLAGDRDMQDRGFEFQVTVRPLAFLARN